ncbi:extracellular exo-alpha-L-arabinofuranosidase [Abditibacteriota bacterium]|nr:extracellular exo-alpha-L-arabinofuranosidase [Abditibacteriota bacterium]
MNKLLSLFSLLLALCFAGVLRANTAQAAAITGKIGVGTWNTQAEFADVKVVQGATTLYQSDFTSGMADWTTSGGIWGTQNGSMRQTGGGTPALALVGNTNWSNYTLTLRARKISGDEGFLIAFGSPGDTTTTWWNIGGYGNTKHLLQVPGVPTSDYAGSVQTGVWYDIKVELSGPDIRCYLNGTLIHDTARFLNMSDRTDRFNQLVNSAGFGLLNNIEKAGLTNLRDRTVYIGDAARATFDAMPMSGLSFAALSAEQQAAIIRKVNRNRMTWVQGYGFDGSNGWRDWYITTNADYVVKLHNSLSVFDKHLTVNNDPNVATADANYDGWMRMGSQMTVRTFVHEIAHTLGSGTYQRWYDLMSTGVWSGQYGRAQIKEFDGKDAEIHVSGVHFYPYGMNYENEYSDENARRAILLMAAMRRDEGLGDQVNWNYSSSVANGTYTLVPRYAPNKVLEVYGSAGQNGAAIDIWTPNGGDNQKFLFDLQVEGTYRIRTALPGNRALDLPYGNTDNGTKLQLWDDNGGWPQRWFLIPTDNGWFKIAPKNNTFKGTEIYYGATADGSTANVWDYTDNFVQQWKILPSAQVAATTTVADGTYMLTPRHATDKVLEVYGFNGANADKIDIWTANGGDNQKFLLDKQSDGTYRIRTKLTGNRDVEMPGGTTDNGTKAQLYDDNNTAGQRWYLIPTDNGYYKIAPKNDVSKGLSVTGVDTADGSLVQSYDYFGATPQQWKLTRIVTNTAPVVNSVSLTPTTPDTNSQMTCTYTASDAEGDVLTPTYLWKKNGAVVSGESGATLDLSKTGNGDKGDAISVTVTVSDGTTSSAAVTSSSITIVDPAATSGVLISEFRLSGPGTSGTGDSTDEFIEVANTTGAPLFVSGWTLVAGSTSLPLSGTIPAYGHLLVTGTGYSLGSYATGDITMPAATNIPLGAKLTLKNAVGTMVDEVNAAGTLTPLSSTTQYSFARRLESGLPQDSDNDSSDFNLVDTTNTNSTTNGTGVGALAGARLGAPGPQNLLSPIQRNMGVDMSSINIPGNSLPGTSVTPEARYVSKNSTIDPKGRLSLRRTIKNNTGSAVTQMRFRIVAITAGNSTTAGVADVRAISSGGVRYYASNGATILQAAWPLVLEKPSSPNEAPLTASSGSGGKGGGLGSTWVVALPGGSLAQGASVGVEFLFGIVTDGNYRVVVDTELLP